MSSTLIMAAAMIIVAAAAAVHDWRDGTIPNWITLPPVAIAPLAHFAAGGWDGALFSIIGLFGCGLVPYILFRRDILGGGDVKLFAALGAIGGLLVGLEAQLYGLIAASLFAVLMLVRQRVLQRSLRSVARIAINPVLPRRLRREVPAEELTTMRLGAPIFVGTAVSLALSMGVIGG